MPQLSGVLDIIGGFHYLNCDMAANNNLLSKINSLEGKLNTFATLVTEREDRFPEYRTTIDAIYTELEELKKLAGAPQAKEEAAPAK